MRISITVGLGARAESTIPGLVARAQELEALGFQGVWMPNAFGFDAITALAVVASQTTRVEIGTAMESDVDLLVTFRPSERWTITDLVRMERTLTEMLGREVDLVERAAVEENPDPAVRREILGNARLLSIA